MHIALEERAKRTGKKMPDELYKAVLAFSETGEVVLFRNKNYQVSVSIGMNSSQMRHTICVFDNSAGPNLIRAKVLDLIWLDSIRQRDMPDIRTTSHRKLELSATIILHLPMGGSRTRVNFGVVNELVMPLC